MRERREFNPDDAIGKLVPDVACHGQGQAGLAGAARTGQGQQGNGLFEEQCTHHCTLFLPADQSRARDRECGGIVKNCLIRHHGLPAGDHRPWRHAMPPWTRVIRVTLVSARTHRGEVAQYIFGTACGHGPHRQKSAPVVQ